MAAQVSADQLLGPDQAAEYLEIRRTDWDYLVAAGLISPTKHLTAPVGRRREVTVALYRVGDVDGLRERARRSWSPAIDALGSIGNHRRLAAKVLSVAASNVLPSPTMSSPDPDPPSDGPGEAPGSTSNLVLPQGAAIAAAGLLAGLAVQEGRQWFVALVIIFLFFAVTAVQIDALQDRPALLRAVLGVSAVVAAASVWALVAARDVVPWWASAGVLVSLVAAAAVAGLETQLGAFVLAAIGLAVAAMGVADWFGQDRPTALAAVGVGVALVAGGMVLVSGSRVAARMTLAGIGLLFAATGLATISAGGTVPGGVFMALGAVIAIAGAVWVDRPFVARIVDGVGLLFIFGALANPARIDTLGVAVAIAGVGVILLGVAASLQARPYASGAGLAGVGMTVLGFGWHMAVTSSVSPAAGVLVMAFGTLLLAAGALVSAPGTRGRRSLPARLLVGWGDDLVEKLCRLRHDDTPPAPH
jgi:hypothetical protein